MAKKETPRSKYIRNVTQAQAALSEQMERSTRMMIKDVLHESVKDGISKMFLAEADEDKYEEEEATAALDAEDIDDGKSKETEKKSDKKDKSDDLSGEESADDSADDDVWDRIKDLQGEDGEWDLTGMGNEEVAGILQVMSPEDGVRVVKTDDGDIKLSDENTEQEYIIDPDDLEVQAGPIGSDGEDDDFDGEDVLDDDDDDFDDEDFGDEDDEEDFDDEDDDLDDLDDEDDDSYDDEEPDDDDEEAFDIDADELADMIESAIHNSDEGFQKSEQFYKSMKTPMTTPSNKEPGDPQSTKTWDKVPDGTDKPYPGKVDKKKSKPFTESECCDDNNLYEVELGEPEEEPMEEQVSGFVKKNLTVKKISPDTSGQSGERAGRNASVAGKHVKGTSKPRYSTNESMANIRRKANAIFEENKKMHTLIDKLHKQLRENAVTFYSMGRIVKLLTENTTTRDEKIDIVNRFNDVKNINEGKALYSTILTELKAVNKTRNVGGLTESKIINENVGPSTVVEKSLYKSGEVSRITNLWDRMSKIK